MGRRTAKLSEKLAEQTQTTNQLTHPADKFFCSLPLGAIYQAEATTFRVFAPTASQVCLQLYTAPLGGQATTIPLEKQQDGSWYTVVQQDCLGLYYTFKAWGSDPGFDSSRELIDPYARAITAHDGRAIVVDDHTPIASSPNFSFSDAIIYELHIRDFTIDPDSGIPQRGKYLALTAPNTYLTGRSDISTGLEHLCELGINTVQIMPITEFRSDESLDEYGWGYDSVHFNSPDGWYATERFDARRVTEVKQMVDTLHRRGIKVVLDMVYNHTVECLGKYVYSFEGLVPGYYYRRKRDGHYWNGSGVGNEFRSEAPMARRFIIDSVKYWVTEYKIDGFRFDLMGLIDLVTLIELTKELQAINPDIFIYGEPWTGGDSPIQGVSKGQQRGLGMAVFNDHLRDALKGSVFQARTQGFVQSGDDIVRVKQGIRGAINDFADAPTESINYVECHDNHTLWDRLLISTLDDGRINEAKRRSMNRLAAALLFTAQGIPFIQSGQELLRSKNGHDNTYNQPDAVNMIRWGQKAQNYEIFCYYKGLIALRRAHPLFRLRTALEITNALKFLDSSLGFNLPAQTIGVLITDPTGYDGWQRALLLFNAQTQPVTMTIPVGRWQIFVDHLQASAQPLTNSSLHLEPTSMRVPAHSAVILGEGT